MRLRVKQRKRSALPFPGYEDLVIVPTIPDDWRQQGELILPPPPKWLKTFPPFKRFWCENKINFVFLFQAVPYAEELQPASWFPVKQRYVLFEGDPANATAPYLIEMKGFACVKALSCKIEPSGAVSDAQLLDLNLHIDKDNESFWVGAPYKLALEEPPTIISLGWKVQCHNAYNRFLDVVYEFPLWFQQNFRVYVNVVAGGGLFMRLCLLVEEFCPFKKLEVLVSPVVGGGV